MHRCGLILVALVLWGVGTEGQQTPSAPARARLAAVRAALGGDKALAAVRSVSAQIGRRGRMFGRPGVKPPIEFVDDRMKILMLRPDHALFTLEGITFPGQQHAGFVGDDIIGSGRRWRDREDYGYFLLTLFLESDVVFPFAFVGTSGSALQFRDPHGVLVTVHTDDATQLPLRLTYERREMTTDGEPTGKVRATREELTDFRSVGRLRLPHVIRTFEGDLLLLERRIERLELNLPLTKADFKK